MQQRDAVRMTAAEVDDFLRARRVMNVATIGADHRRSGHSNQTNAVVTRSGRSHTTDHRTIVSFRPQGANSCRQVSRRSEGTIIRRQ